MLEIGYFAGYTTDNIDEIINNIFIFYIFIDVFISV